jgi:hypothetical protein
MSGNNLPRMTSEEAEALLRQRLGSRVIGLRVLIHEGGAILQGTAFSYYAKQLAQHDAMRTLGLVVLANEIEVDPDRHTPDPDALDPA